MLKREHSNNCLMTVYLSVFIFRKRLEAGTAQQKRGGDISEYEFLV